MIEATMLRRGDRLVGWTVKGHSGAAPRGSDIVCAAVSSAVYMAANTVTDICRCPAAIEQADGFLSLRLTDSAADGCQTVLQGLSLHLAALGQQYPTNIQFRITEV